MSSAENASPSEGEKPSVMKACASPVHHCPICDISAAMRSIREALDVMDGAHDAWLDDSTEYEMQAAEYERVVRQFNHLKAWLVRRAKEGHPKAEEPRIEAAERIAWILAGTYNDGGQA